MRKFLIMSKMYPINDTKSSTFPKENFHSYLMSLKRHERKMLNYYLKLNNKYEMINPRNQTIASNSGCGVTSVKKVKKQFERDGLATQSLHVGFANFVSLHPIFEDLKFRRRYSPFLPALKVIPQKYIHSAKRAFSSQEKDVYLNSVHHINILYNYKQDERNESIKLNKTLTYIDTVNRITVREAYGTNRCRFVSKFKGLPMNELNLPWTVNDAPSISKAVMSLTFPFKLSKRGQIELSMFPTSILKSAYRDFIKMTSIKSIEHPLPYFISICKKKCEAEKIASDEKTRDYLLQTNGLSQYDSFSLPAFFEGYAEESDYVVEGFSFESSERTQKGEGNGARKPYESPKEREHLPEELEKAALHFFKYQYAIQWFAVNQGQTYLLPWMSLSHRVQLSSASTTKMFDAKRKQRLMKQEIELYKFNEKLKKEYEQSGTLEQNTMSLEEVRRKIREATTPPVHKTESEVLESEYIPATANWLSLGEGITKTFEQLESEMPSDFEIAAGRPSPVPPKTNEDEFSQTEMSNVNIGFHKKKIAEKEQPRLNVKAVTITKEEKLNKVKEKVDFDKLSPEMVNYIQSPAFDRVLEVYDVDRLVSLFRSSI